MNSIQKSIFLPRDKSLFSETRSTSHGKLKSDFPILTYMVFATFISISAAFEYAHGIQNNFILSKQKQKMKNQNKPYGITKINYFMIIHI